jgi:hypothetical protein
VGNFLTRWATISLSRTTVLHGFILFLSYYFTVWYMCLNLKQILLHITLNLFFRTGNLIISNFYLYSFSYNDKELHNSLCPHAICMHFIPNFWINFIIFIELGSLLQLPQLLKHGIMVTATLVFPLTSVFESILLLLMTLHQMECNLICSSFFYINAMVFYFQLCKFQCFWCVGDVLLVWTVLFFWMEKWDGFIAFTLTKLVYNKIHVPHTVPKILGSRQEAMKRFQYIWNFGYITDLRKWTFHCTGNKLFEN